jgi:WD40 repeat protein
MWDAESGAELACLRGHENEVTSVTYSPDGRRIVSGYPDGWLRVWDAQSGVELACLRVDPVTSVAYSPDGRRIVSGSYYHRLHVWDARSGAKLARLCGHEGMVTSVVYAPDGRRIVSGSSDKTVRVWDAESGVELACLHGHVFDVEGVAYSPDGRRIVSRAGSVMRVWDAASGECLQEIQGSGDVNSVAAAGETFLWRAMRQSLETVIEPAGGGEAVAWFPAELLRIAAHPSGRIWAGADGRHLYLIRLEVEPDSNRTGAAS